MPQLVPATTYIELNPGGVNRSAPGFTQQFAAVDVVVLSDKYTHPQELNASAVPGDASANEVLRNALRPLQRYGPWTVLLPKRVMP